MELADIWTAAAIVKRIGTTAAGQASASATAAATSAQQAAASAASADAVVTEAKRMLNMISAAFVGIDQNANQ